MRRVMCLHRELAEAQDEMSRLFAHDDAEVSEFEADQRSDRPRLRLIHGTCADSVRPRVSELQR
jgi:hypothetical protein